MHTLFIVYLVHNDETIKYVFVKLKHITSYAHLNGLTKTTLVMSLHYLKVVDLHNTVTVSGWLSR